VSCGQGGEHDRARENVAGIGDPCRAAAAVKFAFAENALHKTRLSVLYAWMWFRTRGPAAIITGPLPR